MQRGFIIVLLTLFGLSACNTEQNVAPGNKSTFFKIMMGQGSDKPIMLQEYENGDLLILATTTVSRIEGNLTKVRLIKTDAQGNIVWDQYYPSTDTLGNYQARALVLDKEQQAYVLADHVSTSDSAFMHVLQFDESGKLTKDQNHSGYGLSEGADMVEGNTGELFVLSHKLGAPGFTMQIASFPKNGGNALWKESLSLSTGISLTHSLIYHAAQNQISWAFNSRESSQNRVRVVQVPPGRATPDKGTALSFSANVQQAQMVEKAGQLYMVGTSTSGNNSDLLFASLTNTLAVSNHVGFGGLQVDEGASIAKTEDGGFILFGDTESEEFSSGGKDFWLIRLNDAGAEVWQHAYGSIDQDEKGYYVTQTQDGGFVCLGTTAFGTVPTLSLMKVNKDGMLK